MSNSEPKVIPHPRPRVVVTAAIIERATKRDSSHCMVAEALKIAVPGAKAVSVDIQTIRYTDPVKPFRYVFLTPRVAQVNLLKFDQGLPSIEPFSFQLRHPQTVRAGRFTKKKTKLTPSRSNSGVHRKIGGKTPPLMDSFARRREFGLRMLDR